MAQTQDTVLFKAGFGLVIALLILALMVLSMPVQRRHDVFLIEGGVWTPAGSELEIPVRTDLGLYVQLDKSAQCCAGVQRFRIDLEEIDLPIHNLQNYGLYFPAIGGEVAIMLNGRKVALPQMSWSSIGPVIPLHSLDLFSRRTLEVELEISGRPTALSGLWKGPIHFGEYFRLIQYQWRDRIFQVYTPFMVAIFLAGVAAIFFLIYFMTGRRFQFYLVFAFCICARALFEVFLSGSVRDLDEYWGAGLHFFARILAGLAAFYTLICFLELLGVRITRENRSAIKITNGVVLISAIAALYFGLGSSLQGALLAVVPILFVVYWPIFRWPLACHRIFSLEYAAFVVVILTAFSGLSDATRIVFRFLELKYPFDFFGRYAGVFFFATSFVFFLRHFIRLLSRLQDEQLKSAKFDALRETVRYVAHDVRAPFTHMKTGLALFKKDAMQGRSDQVKAFEVTFNRSLDRVNSMLTDILTVGKETPVRVTEIEVESLIRGVLEEVSQKYESKSISTIVEIPNKLLVRVDSEKMSRVLMNIVENAYQAEPRKGSVEVRVSRANEIIQIGIQNRGSFIPEGDANRIFEEFFSVGKKYGTGLGLTIAKQFVESHGGQISCQSKRSSGTVFTILLPA